MAQPRPFKINIPDHELDLLRQKLELTRLPDEPEGYTLQQGVPVAKMQHMLRYWKDDYLPKWRQQEAKLNELPMFTLPVETDGFGSLDIHFIHARSERANATPLLFVHGWPGSFLEVTKMLKGLTSPPDEFSPAFHVVAPSLPNYGFSEGVKKRGFNLRHYGFVLNKLMLDLGYNQYVSQGGDWGSIITRKMGTHHSQHLRGIHVNLAVFDWWNLLKQPWLFLLALIWPPFWPSRKGFDGLRRAYRYVVDGNAYYQMHATRPQTVAFCLEDSPAGLLGWIYEKLLHWTDDYPWTEDEVLTWVSLYWFSRAGPGASVRTYFEAEHPSKDWGGVPSDNRFWDYTEPKLGISQFPKDIAGIPDFTTKTLGPVVYRNWPKVGGHFASWEQPDILVQDLRAMFGVGGPAYSAIGIQK